MAGLDKQSPLQWRKCVYISWPTPTENSQTLHYNNSSPRVYKLSVSAQRNYCTSLTLTRPSSDTILLPSSSLSWLPAMTTFLGWGRVPSHSLKCLNSLSWLYIVKSPQCSNTSPTGILDLREMEEVHEYLLLIRLIVH